MKHNHKDLAAQLQQIADRFPHLNPHNSQPDGAAGPVRSLAEPPHCMVARRSDLNKRSLIPTLPKATWIAETNTPIPETSTASPFVNIRVHSWKKKKQETCEVCSSEAAQTVDIPLFFQDLFEPDIDEIGRSARRVSEFRNNNQN